MPGFNVKVGPLFPLLAEMSLDMYVHNILCNGKIISYLENVYLGKEKLAF
jgi:hypothetical protein